MLCIAYYCNIMDMACMMVPITTYTTVNVLYMTCSVNPASQETDALTCIDKQKDSGSYIYIATLW